MTDDIDRDIERITDGLTVVYRGLQHVNIPTWLKLDLSMAQLKALVAVVHQPGLSVCQMARQLSIGESAASLMSDQLVRRGHVERVTDPDDRRRVRLSATESGQRVLDELREGNRHVLREWLGRLDDEQRRALAQGVQALAEAADASLTLLVAAGRGAEGEES